MNKIEEDMNCRNENSSIKEDIFSEYDNEDISSQEDFDNEEYHIEIEEDMTASNRVNRNLSIEDVVNDLMNISQEDSQCSEGVLQDQVSNEVVSKELVGDIVLHPVIDLSVTNEQKSSVVVLKSCDMSSSRFTRKTFRKKLSSLKRRCVKLFSKSRVDEASV